MVADTLNITRAEMHGIVTFYHDFRETPPGAHVLKLCRAEACQSMGADGLAAEARQQLQIDWGETSPDGRITLEPVFCLGLCACAPAAMLDGKLYGGLDRTRLGVLLDRAKQL
jgi:formate dehydrogenase subunit gamma